jgi:hypothetical protein
MSSFGYLPRDGGGNSVGMNHYAPIIAPVAPMFQSATHHNDTMNMPQPIQFPQPNSGFSYYQTPAQQPTQDPHRPKLPRAAPSQQRFGPTNGHNNVPRRPTLAPVSNTHRGGTTTNGLGRPGNTNRQTNLTPLPPCLTPNKPGLSPTKRDDPLREASQNLMKHLIHLDKGLAKQSDSIKALQNGLAESEKSRKENGRDSEAPGSRRWKSRQALLFNGKTKAGDERRTYARRGEYPEARRRGAGNG